MKILGRRRLAASRSPTLMPPGTISTIFRHDGFGSCLPQTGGLPKPVGGGKSQDLIVSDCNISALPITGPEM